MQTTTQTSTKPNALQAAPARTPAIQMGLLGASSLPVFKPGERVTMTVEGLPPVTFNTPLKPIK